MAKRSSKIISKQKHIDDLTEEEIKDVKEYYASNDREIVSAKELLEELHKQRQSGVLKRESTS